MPVSFNLKKRRSRWKVVARLRRDANPLMMLLLALNNPTSVRRSAQSCDAQHLWIGNQVDYSNIRDIRRECCMFLADVTTPLVRRIRMDTRPRDGAAVQTMPLFPLRGAAYLPFTKVQMHVFEPRHIAMFRDIIAMGTRRFAVCGFDTADETRLTETAAVFHLNDLGIRETDNEPVEYIGDFTVVSRVKLLKVLNPHNHESTDTYLHVEVEEIVDSDVDVNTTLAEAELKDMFDDFIKLQERMDENPRISPEFAKMCSFDRNDLIEERSGLWNVVHLWQELLKQRTLHIAAQAKEQMDTSFLRYEEEMVARQSLAPDFVKDLEDIYRIAMDDLELSQSRPDCAAMLAFVQSTSHSERLSIFKYVLDEEYKRLKSAGSLRSLFLTVPNDG